MLGPKAVSDRFKKKNKRKNKFLDTCLLVFDEYDDAFCGTHLLYVYLG
jgi:hypothetical protein